MVRLGERLGDGGRVLVVDADSQVELHRVSGPGSASPTCRARGRSAIAPTGWRRGFRPTPTLKRAFSEMLQHDAGWVAVLDGDH
jgi:hypothetical protein